MSTSTNGKAKGRAVKVRREVFLRDPAATMKRALSSGRVIIVDAGGREQAVITVPQDRLPSTNS